MVSYQKWTSVAFDVAQTEKGMENSRENASELVSVVAEIWRDRKEELQAATVAEAKQIARTEISV